MAVLQVNALFKKAAPAPAKKAAPAKKGGFGKKAAPAPKKKAAPAKKAAPKKKVAPKKTVVRKAAPVKKTSGKPSQAGGDASKWYGTYLLPRREEVVRGDANPSPNNATHDFRPLARARDRRDVAIARLDRIDETRDTPAFIRRPAIRPVAIASRATRGASRLRLHRVPPR
jgi:hypothetical protein